MALALANIDADLQITYVFNGVENVGSTKTMLSATQMLRTLLSEAFHLQESCHFRLSAATPRAAAQTQAINALHNKTRPFSNCTFSWQAEILRKTTLL